MMAKGALKFVFAAGGTGGHIYPALAVARRIKEQEPRSEIIFIGTKNHLESTLVPKEGFSFRTIWISGFQRKNMMKNILVPLKIIISMIQSFIILLRTKPKVIIGTGGYVCGPVLAVGTLLRIPTVIHESNSVPGVTTRLLAKSVTKVFTGYQATIQYFERSTNMEYVGTPVRANIIGGKRGEACGMFGLDPTGKTVLVFGGSLGSASINRAIANVIPELSATNTQLIWQTGDHEYLKYEHLVRGRKGFWLGRYIYNMPDAYAASDLVICRAGAMTLAELSVTEKPSILIPYSHAANDHQMCNAKQLENIGAAIVIKDDAVYANLREVLITLLRDESRLKKMEESFKAFPKIKADEVMATKILAMVH